jgi:succinate dehydrogenase / fumarate reductase iron-sulfur subunit
MTAAESLGVTLEAAGVSPGVAAFTLRIRRQASPASAPYWQGFSLAPRPHATVAHYLTEAREQSLLSGKGALEWSGPCAGSCRGACALLVDGRPVTACGTVLESPPSGQVTIEPLSKFLVIRDLVVDREPLENAIHALELGAVAATPSNAPLASALSRCTRCGLCMEACPQVNQRSDYTGPAVMAHVLVFNARPDGQARASERLRAIMGRGGLADCGNAQNCATVCPFDVPLLDALGELGHQTTALWFARLLRR